VNNILLLNVKNWGISENIPQFSKPPGCEKDLKDNKNNSLYLGQKYAWIFVLGHYLFLVAHSFPQAKLLENCLLLHAIQPQRAAI